MPVAIATSRVTQRYLGDAHTMTVHDLDAEQYHCRVDQILEAGHGRAMSPDTPVEAARFGLARCRHCLG